MIDMIHREGIPGELFNELSLAEVTEAWLLSRHRPHGGAVSPQDQRDQPFTPFVLGIQ